MTRPAEQTTNYNGLGEAAFFVGTDYLEYVKTLSREDRLAVLPHILGAVVYEAMGDDCTAEEVDVLIEAVNDVGARLTYQRDSIQYRIDEVQRRSETPLLDD